MHFYQSTTPAAIWSSRQAAIRLSNIFPFLGICLLALTCSCATPRLDMTPIVEVPEGFSQSGDEILADQWWTQLGDPALNRLIDLALADNLTFSGAWDRLAQAEAIARREGADLRPSLDLTAGGSRSRSREATPLGQEQTNYNNQFSLGLAASYELDVWGRVRSTRDAAQLDLYASREDLQAAAITLSAQVATTWYQWVEQRAQLALLGEQIKNNERELELITLRFRSGMAAAADVLRQRQLVESTRGERIQIESRAQVLAHQLSVLLGHAPADDLPVDAAGFPALPDRPATGLPSELIERRPDIRQAYYKVYAADRRLAAAIADRYPRLTLSASADTSAQHVGDLFEASLLSIAANAVAPIADGGRRAAEVERTQAAVSENIHSYAQVVLEAFQEVEDALVQEDYQRAYLENLDSQVMLSEQVIERIRDRYLNGAVDYLNVLDALLSNQNLQRSRLTAQRELIEYRVGLYRALAGGWSLPSSKPQAYVENGVMQDAITNQSFKNEDAHQ